MADASAAQAALASGFDRGRYLRVVWFFAGAIGHFVVWEILLRLVLGRQRVESSAAHRWGRIARRFRALAVDLGGVLIKLGQFLSIRVDILPQVVTTELAGLQDMVPAERLPDIRAVVESEFGQSLEQVFDWFSPEPEAAASLAQVHRARLSTGEEVVVKIQRPRIESLVETDLRAIHTATRWLRRYPPIRRRVDLGRLFQEFGSTTRRELDFVAERRHMERFAANFQGDRGVRVPRVYGETSTRRVLVMENVSSLKIGDFAALDEAGISRKEVARRLFDTYMKQFFVHNFVHADPHPGNLFVQPLGEGTPAASAGDKSGISTVNRSFLLTFVDFGMVATVPERVREHFRDYLFGFATRDAARMVRAYQGAGVLLPGADLVRLEQVEAELLDRYWGLTMGQAQRALMNEWQSLAGEYRDILYEMPFQIPTDLLFVGRALAILVGMATSLDPEFDPWAAILPFAESIAGRETGRNWRDVLQEVERMLRQLAAIPGQADRVLGRAARGELTVRTILAPEAARQVRRVEAAVNRLAWSVIFAALLVAGVALYAVQGPGLVVYLLGGLSALALVAGLTRR